MLNCSPIALTAPLITAVSKPKRNPPSAAVAATSTTRVIGTEMSWRPDAWC